MNMSFKSINIDCIKVLLKAHLVDNQVDKSEVPLCIAGHPSRPGCLPHSPLKQNRTQEEFIHNRTPSDKLYTSIHHHMNPQSKLVL